MFYKYLLEIKYRAFFSFIAWISLILNCYLFKETLLYAFIKFNSFYNNYEPTYFLVTSVTEVFTTYLQLSYFIANQVTFWFICYQIFIFISTGLHKFEHAFLKTTSIVIVICWVLFLWALNCVIFPVSWSFFLQFQNFMFAQNLTFYFEAKLNEYWIFYITIYHLGCFAYQQIVFFWILLSVFKTNFLLIKRLRKILYFIFFVIATVVTPPDVTHQLITSVCIIIIYELILISVLLKIEYTL